METEILVASEELHKVVKNVLLKALGDERGWEIAKGGDAIYVLDGDNHVLYFEGEAGGDGFLYKELEIEHGGLQSLYEEEHSRLEAISRLF